MREKLITVVKNGEGKPRTSFDVSFDLLAAGNDSMMTQMHYKVGNTVPAHAHPNEQAGYILSGRVRVSVGEEKVELQSGDTYVVPANAEHSLEIIEDTEEIQVFTPIRPEFL